MLVSLTRVSVIYIVKEFISLFRGARSINGRNRTCARASSTDQQEESCF